MMPSQFAQEVPHQGGEKKAPIVVWVLISPLTLGMLVTIWLLIARPGPDPTVRFFEQWLNADPACNPVAYHAPFRDDLLFYVSPRETEVRAAMNGTIKGHQHSDSVDLFA